MLLIITSTDDEFLRNVNIDDLEWPWTLKILILNDFLAIFGCKRVNCGEMDRDRLRFLVCNLIISWNINQFSKFFHCQNQETICNKTYYYRSHHFLSVSLHYLVKYQTTLKPATPMTSCAINVDRACHVAPKQPELKSSQLCGLGCSSTDGLPILTIHDSQPAEAGDCRWVGQTAAAVG